MSVKSSFNGMRHGKALDAHGVEGETLLTRAVKMQQHDAIKDFLELAATRTRKNAGRKAPFSSRFALMDAKAIDTHVIGGAAVFVKKDGMTFKEHAKKSGPCAGGRARGNLRARTRGLCLRRLGARVLNYPSLKSRNL